MLRKFLTFTKCLRVIFLMSRETPRRKTNASLLTSDTVPFLLNTLNRGLEAAVAPSNLHESC